MAAKTKGIHNFSYIPLYEIQMALSVYMAISNIGDERINGTNQM